MELRSGKWYRGGGASAGTKALQASAKTRLNDPKIIAENRQFEVLKFTALDGREVDLNRMRGKVVLIDFWATWCKPCVEEMPFIKALHENHGAHGLEIIGISGDDCSKGQLAEFLRKGGYGWVQHFDGKGTENHFAQLFGVKAWPTTYLIDRSGKVTGER